MEPPRSVYSILFAVLVMVGCGGSDMKSSVEAKQVDPFDETISEEWIRVTDEEDIRGVGAYRTGDGNWQWSVFINVAEFVRTEPLQSRLWGAVINSLYEVEGVEAVIQEDREVWLIQGDVSGEALIQASGSAIDEMYPELKETFDALFDDR